MGNPFFGTKLKDAVFNMHDSTVRELLENGADPNDGSIRLALSKLPLSYVSKESKNILKLLITYGVKFEGILFYDLARLDYDIIEHLIKHNPGIVNTEVYGSSFLTQAIGNYRKNDIIKLLLSKGADANFEPSWKMGNLTLVQNPLERAVSTRNKEIMWELLRHGAKKPAEGTYQRQLFDRLFNLNEWREYLSKELKEKSWSRIRLLWIGREKPINCLFEGGLCVLGKLPREIIRQITKYIYDQEKKEVGWFELE